MIDRDRSKSSIHFCSSVNCCCQTWQQAQTCPRCDNHQLPSPMSSHHPLFPNCPAFACIFCFLTVWVNNFFTFHPIKASLERGPFISNQFPARHTPSCSGRSQEAKAHSSFLHSFTLSRYLIPSIRHYILTVVMSTASCASPLPPHLLRSDPSRCIVVLKDPFVKLCERANSVHDSEIQEIMSNLIQTSRPSSSYDSHISGSSSHSTTPSADAMIYKLKLEMDTRFNRLHSEITGLKNENSGLNNEITGLYNEITGLNNEITGLKNGNTGFKTEITRLNNNITVLQNENTGFKERISELETGEAAQKKEIAEVRAGDRKNRGRIGRLEAQIKETKNERDEYRSARDKVNQELNATVRDLEERLETLEDLGWVSHSPYFDRTTSLLTIIGWRGRESHSHPRLD